MHIRCVRDITVQMDRVKFAACCAETAPNALVQVDGRRSAFQTAVRLGAHLLLAERFTQIAECGFCIARLEARTLAVRVVIRFNTDIIAVKFDEFTEITSDR
jgi:hypothetical protein